MYSPPIPLANSSDEINTESAEADICSPKTLAASKPVGVKIISLLGIKLQNKKILKQVQDIKKIKLVKNKKYVLKIDSKQAIHKNRLGGLVLNIDNNNFRLEALKLFKKFKKFSA